VPPPFDRDPRRLLISLLRDGQPVRLPTRGASMAPTIISGNFIVVSSVSAGDLKPRDIALFTRGAALYAHRFVGWRQTADGDAALEFCGDASSKSDPLIAAEDVIGIVRRIEGAEDLEGEQRRPALAVRRLAMLASLTARAGYRLLNHALAMVASSVA
jgi:hypothetical protein